MLDGLRACIDDADWFSVDLGEGDGLTVRLEMLGNAAGVEDELDFVMFGPGQGSQVLASQAYSVTTAPGFFSIVRSNSAS